VIDHPEIEVKPLNVTTPPPALLFASMGQNYTHPAMVAGSHVTLESGYNYDTLKLLCMQFMPSALVIVFIFLAYDITISLVPLSEYLNGFEAEGKNPIPDLCTFKDSIAKNMYEKTPEMIATTNGDLHRLHEIVVEKYHQHKSELSQGRRRSAQLGTATPEETAREGKSPRWGGKVQNLASIGLTTSLWPADLLMRQDVDGDVPKNFRIFWIIFAIIAFFWLANLQVFLILLIVKEAKLIVQNFDLEEAIPLTIVLMHMVAVGIVVHVYYITLRPLWQTRRLKATLSDR